MKSEVIRLGIQTDHDTQVIDITDRVKEAARSTGVQNGVCYATTMHTTSGIMVNEGLPDVEDDIISMLQRTAPELRDDHRHQRFLPSDGQMAVNSCSHQRSHLTGMQVAFPVQDGELVMGGRQTIYFAEFDGPLYREFIVHVIGV
ncbi:secondary thiamine-phosphate synthase enzyme YjbQ [Ruicaihuangia caeni]|uniref:Secondary thiamine-phosphate synthase enzyme YjbQ n=1 Tax=Ruicaihuangia caeni TaxID=3042517 RepID=A0AAW6T604_9MICO|nr:secondary thiamine-phosphate synthase enzyme YjbQ [Klugiella sp. YN-L-19]MDI2099202.1 secondary thiamine-phosphate synthase enzyme YjbQ [Klugiella sp. YN-L-19]